MDRRGRRPEIGDSALIWYKCAVTGIPNVFPTVPDPRTKLETIVRSNAMAFNGEALGVMGGFAAANLVIQSANTIDVLNPQTYSFWSRDAANAAWILRNYQPNAILAPGC
jgi:hypothetical protein